MERMNWWHFLYGLCQVLHDIFTQRYRCWHLPTRLDLPPAPQMIAIVTGATSGIGVEIARNLKASHQEITKHFLILQANVGPSIVKLLSRELAKTGAHVILAVRNIANGEKLIRQWESDQTATNGPPLKAEVMSLDLLSLKSVRNFAEEWKSRDLPLTVLINNAGIFAMGVKQKFSEDGYEQHMQVNHLGHALLSILLLPSLLRGSPSRIINVSSEMHYVGIVDPEDFNLTKKKYSAMAAYSGSKLAQILFSHVLTVKIPKDANVDVINVHPGEVMTSVTRDLPMFVQKAEIITSPLRFKPIEGARSVLFCATDNHVHQYARALRNMKCPLSPYFTSPCRPAHMAFLAGDLDRAEKVWDKTLELVDIREDDVDDILKCTENAAEDKNAAEDDKNAIEYNKNAAEDKKTA